MLQISPVRFPLGRSVGWSAPHASNQTESPISLTLSIEPQEAVTNRTARPPDGTLLLCHSQSRRRSRLCCHRSICRGLRAVIPGDWVTRSLTGQRSHAASVVRPRRRQGQREGGTLAHYLSTINHVAAAPRQPHFILVHTHTHYTLGGWVGRTDGRTDGRMDSGSLEAGVEAALDGKMEAGKAACFRACWLPGCCLAAGSLVVGPGGCFPPRRASELRRDALLSPFSARSIRPTCARTGHPAIPPFYRPL